MYLIIRMTLCSFGVFLKTYYEYYCQCQKKKAIWFILVFCLLGCWDSAFLGFSIFSCLRVVVFSEANKIPFQGALHLDQKTGIQVPIIRVGLKNLPISQDCFEDQIR